MKHIEVAEDAWDVENGEQVQFGSVPPGRGLSYVDYPRSRFLSLGSSVVCLAHPDFPDLVNDTGTLTPDYIVIARPGLGWIDTIEDGVKVVRDE